MLNKFLLISALIISISLSYANDIEDENKRVRFCIGDQSETSRDDTPCNSDPGDESNIDFSPIINNPRPLSGEDITEFENRVIKSMVHLHTSLDKINFIVELGVHDESLFDETLGKAVYAFSDKFMKEKNIYFLNTPNYHQHDGITLDHELRIKMRYYELLINCLEAIHNIPNYSAKYLLNYEKIDIMNILEGILCTGGFGSHYQKIYQQAILLKSISKK